MKIHDLMLEVIELGRDKMRNENAAPFAAFVIKDGEIVGKGWNRTLQDLDPTAHGEIVAIRNACSSLHTFDLTGCEIVSSCEPCPMCSAAILYSKLSRLYYAATLEDSRKVAPYLEVGRVISEITTPVDRRRLPSQQLLRTDAAAVLDEWPSLPGFRAHFRIV